MSHSRSGVILLPLQFFNYVIILRLYIQEELSIKCGSRNHLKKEKEEEKNHQHVIKNQIQFQVHVYLAENRAIDCVPQLISTIWWTV